MKVSNGNTAVAEQVRELWELLLLVGSFRLAFGQWMVAEGLTHSPRDLHKNLPDLEGKL